MQAVLLLNASYEPLMTVSWQRAVTLVLADRAELVEQREDVVRSAGGFSMHLPAVVRLLKMAPFQRSSAVPLTRRALTARDQHECQVVGCRDRGTTIDHVLPRSRGGRHVWENVALMCFDHNSSKDDRLLSELGWSLKRKPFAPVGRIALKEAVASDPLMARWAAI